MIGPLATGIVQACESQDQEGTPESLWALLPPAGDARLLGLVPWLDLQTFPPLLDAATPATQASMPTAPRDLSTLPGLNVVATRIYQPAGPAIGTADYAAPPTDTDPATRQDLALTISIYDFATTEDPQAAFPEIAGSLSAGALTGTVTSNEAELTDMGDQASSEQIVITTTGFDWTRQTMLEQVTVPNDTLVIVLESVSTRQVNDPDEAADESSPLADIVAEDHPAATPVIVTNCGTSTGGLWNLIPAAGDPSLMGLVPVTDMLIP